MRPTIERLRAALAYEPDTGLLRWRIPRRCRVTGGGRGATVGDIAGSPTRNGGWRVKLDGCEMPAAVAAFAIVEGRWPEGDVDHEDRDRMNNRWKNLRESTRSQNIANAGAFPHSSRYKGVSFDKQTGRWRARIKVKGTLIALGRYSSEEEAHAAYVKAAQEHFGRFARAA